MKKEKKRIVLENIIVTDYAAEGKALAKIDGKVIFISGAVPGDLVDVFLTKNKKNISLICPECFRALSQLEQKFACSLISVIIFITDNLA